MVLPKKLLRKVAPLVTSEIAFEIFHKRDEESVKNIYTIIYVFVNNLTPINLMYIHKKYL